MSTSYKNGSYKTKTTIIDNPTFHTPLQVDRLNGVRTYRPYMTTLEALQDKEKKKRRKKILIIACLFIFLLTIGAVSVALALTVFKKTPTIEDKNIPSAVPSSIPYNMLTTLYPDTQEILVGGEVRLDVRFPRLHSEQEDLTRKFVLAVDSLYKDSLVKQYYESTSVTQLRPGSVVVYFDMLIKEPIGKNSIHGNMYPKTKQVIEIFYQETIDGQLGEYQLYPESVKLYIKNDKDKVQTTTQREPVGVVTTSLVDRKEPLSTNTPVRPLPRATTVSSHRAETTPQLVRSTKPVTTHTMTQYVKTTQPTTTTRPTTTLPVATTQPTTRPVTTTQPTTTRPTTTQPTTTQPTTTQPTTTQPTTTQPVTTTQIVTTTHLATTQPTTVLTTITTTVPTTHVTTETITTEKSTTQQQTTEELTSKMQTTISKTTEVTTVQEDTTSANVFPTTFMSTTAIASTQNQLQTTDEQRETTSVKLPDVFGDDCDSLTCLNGGSCDDASGFATCQCVEGYFGLACDQSECDFKTCDNGGTCRADGMYNVVCECPDGYLGVFCEIALSVQPCISNPCKNGGNCTVYYDDYFCNCPYPYGGYNCEKITIDEENTPPPMCLQVPLDVCRQQVPYNTSGLDHPYGVVDSPEEASERIIHYRNILQSCNENIDRLLCLIFSPECPLESGFPRSACSDYCLEVLYSCSDTIDPLTQETYEAINTLLYICMVLPSDNEEVCIGPQEIEQTVDLCSSNPCLNGGSCTSYGAGELAYYMCECLEGYIGEICDVEFDFTPSICTASTCLNGATCEEDDYLPKCICPEGFIGQQCEIEEGSESSNGEDMYASICSDVMSSCINVLPYNLTSNPDVTDQDYSGQDTVEDQFQRSVAACDHPDVERFLCSVLNPECVPSNALIGAPRTACKSLCNQIRVSCPNLMPMNSSTFEQYCDHMIESNDIVICIPPSNSVNSTESDHICSNVTCQNGGICFEFEGNPLCKCKEGYFGSLCTLEYNDPCLSSPCLNQGLCVTDVTNFYVSYECECMDDGFYGTHCEQSICDDFPCSNGGTCIPNAYTSECICPERYVGSYCEIDLYPADPCQSNPCFNEATCVSQKIGLFSAYYCECLPSNYGRNCEHDNPCIPNPCHHSGHCTHNETGSFACSCAQGYVGVRCEDTVLDPCSSNPCLNGGVCINDGTDYSCVCTQGYDGDNCQQEVGERDQTT